MNSTALTKLLCMLFLLFLSTGLAQAKIVRVEGNAVITDTGIGKARQLAVQDAVRQASLQAGARVKSSSKISSSVLVEDSVQIRSQGTVRNVVVLDEWVNEEYDLYYVLIQATVSDNADQQTQKTANRYRRKVAITQFYVADRSQIHDMPNVEINLAKEFIRRLERSGQFYTVDATQFSLVESAKPFIAVGKTASEVVVNFAEEMGVQFVLSGVIKDMGVTKHPLWIQLRHVELEISVYDGLSGALISKRTSNGSVWEDNIFDFPTTTPVMNDKFYAAPIGREINKVVQTLVAQVGADVSTLPFMARVLRVTGKKVLFDVGGLSQVKVGDVFMTYHIADNGVYSESGLQFMGFEETPASALVIKQVQPLFSVGELESQSVRVQPGDVVRFSW